MTNRLATAARGFPVSARRLPALALAAFLLPGCAAAGNGGSGATTGGLEPAAGSPFRVVHAWPAFLAFHERAGAAGGGERRALAESVYLEGGGPLLEAYFAARAGGDLSLALDEWASMPPAAFEALAGRLAEPAVRAALEAEAARLGQRLGASLPAPAESVAVLWLVGGFEAPVHSFRSGATRVITVQLETLVPLPEDLSDEALEAIEFARVWAADTLPPLPESVAPWSTWGVARQYVPEIRDRIENDTANLAEYVLLRGFSTRLAAALHPESIFAGAGPVRAAAAAALHPAWRQVGEAWFPLGTEPYLAALFDERLREPLPAGATLAQAVSVVGAELAREWLDATRIGRERNEAAEIARLGRVPTLNAWGILQP